MRKLVLVSFALLVAGCAKANESAPRPTEVVAPAKRAKQATPTIIELRVTDKDVPAPQKAAPQNAAPATVSADARPGEPFAAKSGDGTIAVNGTLHALSGGKYRVHIRYAEDSAMTHRGFQSIIEMRLGEEQSLGGMLAEGGIESVVLRLLQAQ